MTSPATARPSTNPFLAAPQAEADAPEAEHVRPRTITKPWGHEVVFADGSHGYVGKLLHVRAGNSLSLQRHHLKDETISVVSGEVVLESGPAPDDLLATTMTAGDTVHLPPTVLHRITAVAGDAVLVEASSASPGWAHDVERIEDAHGRAGTSAP